MADLDRARQHPPPVPLEPEVPDFEPDNELDDEPALPAPRRPARLAAH